MKNTQWTICLIAVLICTTSSAIFDYDKNDKHGETLSAAMCNPQTQIDFDFSANSRYNMTGTVYNQENPGQSTLQFLDSFGQNISYSLSAVEVNTATDSISQTNPTKTITFKFTQGTSTAHIVYVQIGFVTSPINARQIDLTNSAVKGQLAGLINFITGKTTNLAVFNFLNDLDYGHFYTVAKDTGTSKVTILSSYWVYYFSPDSLFDLEKATTQNFTMANVLSLGFEQTATGDLLCYGALNNGVFQTHMRQSWPLWVAWGTVLIFWVYNLLTTPTTDNCNDTDYQNNKWTCWGFYSLFWLGNQDYFTKLSRSTLLYINFSVQALVLAILYGQLGQMFDASMIPWTAPIAFVASLPFSYILGGVFLRSISNTNIKKFEIQKRIKEILNEQSGKALQEQVDKVDQKLYGLYYWYYVFCLIIYALCWIFSVYDMQSLQREYYWRHGYWLASLAIVFFFDNLIWDPLMTFFFGNFRFYQIRGFWYDYRMGELHKTLEH